MLPVVAIVGRPNVGKSTLFNRLSRTKNALVSAHPGTTRDRQFGEVHEAGRDFIIIDTGGMEDDNDPLHQLILEQALAAMHDADQIIWVIDGKNSLAKEDMRIATLLRRLQKPTTVAVNKTENIDPDLAVSEAWELGFQQTLPISAKEGKGLRELITTLFPEPSPTEKEDKAHTGIKLAIVGRPNVGKSTLVNRMLGEPRVIAHDTPGTTRDSIHIPLSRYDQQYVLIDTAGVRRRKNITALPEKFSVVKTLQAIEEADVVIYVLDARDGVKEQDLKLLDFVVESGKALVLAANKWDGMTPEEREATKQEIDRRLGMLDFARLHFISARHGTGVGNLFDSVEEAYASATKDLPTPVLSRLLEKAITQHAPPLIRGRRIKLRYAHAGGSQPPVIIIHGTQLKALPESYQKFLSHFFMKALKLRGTPVRIHFKDGKNPYSQRDD
jgi:GTP-binding protein